jgi:hypothetical protein
MNLETALKESSLTNGITSEEFDKLMNSGIRLLSVGKSRRYVESNEQIENLYHVVDGDFIEVLPLENNELEIYQDHIVSQQIFGELRSDSDHGEKYWKARRKSVVLVLDDYTTKKVFNNGGTPSINLGFSVLQGCRRSSYLEAARLSSFTGLKKLILFLNFEMIQSRKLGVKANKYYTCEKMGYGDMSKFIGISRETISRSLKGNSLLKEDNILVEKIKKLDHGLAYKNGKNLFITRKISSMVHDIGLSKLKYSLAN